MKIKSIKIKNFRSLADVSITVPDNDVLVLLGQNNAGKSAVINAIRLFYGDYKLSESDFCRSNPNEQIEIEIEFVFADDTEFDSLPSEYKLENKRLRVIKRYSKEVPAGEAHGFTQNGEDEIENVEEFFGSKNVHVGKLGDVIHIPAVKDLSQEINSNKTSIFTKLITRIFSDRLSTLNSYNDLVTNTKRFVQELKSPVKESSDSSIRSINEIEQELDTILNPWDLSSNIDLTPPTPEDIILGGVKLLITDKDGEEEDPFKLGSGAQRSIVNGLIRLWSKIENKKDPKERKNFNSKLQILLYEEPEALLHYDQELKLLRDLEAISKTEENQVIICTHSPNLVSSKESSLTSIVRLKKITKITKKFQASKDFLNKLDLGKGAFDFTLWLNPDRNTMFFVDKVVLVEGPTDKVFLNYLINKNNLLNNIYVVDCGGKEHIPTFMALCGEFGIDHKVMYDRDNDKNPECIQRNKNIEDSKNAFTREIVAFADQLENEIHIETENKNKPIQLLVKLRNGDLSNNDEKRFIDFLTRQHD